jgi:hypothetical protein
MPLWCFEIYGYYAPLEDNDERLTLFAPSNDYPVILYHDFRSASAPNRRRTNQLTKYGLLHTWRHSNPIFHLTPESRSSHRLWTLVYYQSSGRLILPKTHFLIPPTQLIQHYGIKPKTLRAHPRGKAKREFLQDCRDESKLQRCRDWCCCFRHHVERSAAKGKRRLRREGVEAALEYRNGELDRWEDEEMRKRAHFEDEFGPEIDTYVWPRRGWEGLVDGARVDRRLRRGRLRGEVTEAKVTVKESNDDYGSEIEDGSVSEVMDGEEWAVVECLGFLSDAESWEEDFDSVISESCSA